MNLVFIGPPYAGKGTQTKLLAEKLKIPVFSMGALIREEYIKKTPQAVEGLQQYSIKGRHVPIELKFSFLKEKLDILPNGFILDNFPATEEDLNKFNDYLDEKKIKVDRVIYIWISEEEMRAREKVRGREDDKHEIIKARRRNQDLDRVPVLEYYRDKGILIEINGEKKVEEVFKDILEKLEINN